MEEKYLIGKTKFCYSVASNDVKSFLNEVDYAIKNKYKIIELRLEGLIFEGLSIDLIINIVNTAINLDRDIIYIANINTIENGDKLILKPEKYYSFIKKLYFETNVNIIELNYLFYSRDKDIYDNFILDLKREKEFILSCFLSNNNIDYKSFFDMFNIVNYEKFEIVKVLFDAKSKNSLFNFMSISRKFSKKAIKNNIGCIFIGLNKIGILSKIYNEYANTKIVYINDKFGENYYTISNEKYAKFRKKIHFLFK